MQAERNRSKRRVVMGAVIGFALLLTSGVAVASDVGSSSNVIHGCVDRVNGNLRVVSGRDVSCSKHETPISWNQQGSAGPPGPPGPPGSPGAGVQGITLHADVDVPLVSAQSCINMALNLPGRQASDHVLVNPTGNLPLGIVVMGIFDVNTPDVEPITQLRICNVTSRAIDPPYGDWGFVLFRDIPNGR